MTTIAKSLIIAIFPVVGVYGQAADRPASDRYLVEKEELFTLDKKEKLQSISVSAGGDKVALVIGKGKKFYVWHQSDWTSGEFQQKSYANFSPDGSRLAVIGDKKDGIYVYVDGREHGPYQVLLEDSVIFSPDGSRYAFATGRGKSYGNIKDYSVVIDGIESARYKHMFESPPQFSPDSRQAVYFAGDKKHWFAVVNGVPKRKFERTGFGPTFSPDGSQMAYIGLANDSAYLVVNDSVVGVFWGFHEMAYSPTTNDLVYCARERSDSPLKVYLNHEPVEMRTAAQWPVFSPDGQRLAYWTADSSGQYAVVDSVLYGPHPYLLRLHFSPGGSHFYYAWAPDVPQNGISTINFTVDGQTLPTMRGKLSRPSRHWSPDDSRFAYAWDISDENDAICIEGVVDSGYTILGNVVFSPDSKRWAYLGQKKGDKGVKLYLDGEVIERDKSIGPNVAFSPDSRDVAYFVSDPDDMRYLVINDTEFERFEVTYPLKVAFSDDGSITFYALKDRKVYRVRVAPVGK